MDNEATRLINDEPAQKEQATPASQSQPEAPMTSKAKKGNTIAAAAGAFVAGAAAGAATTAAASTPNIASEQPVDVKEEVATEKTPEAPAPEQVILANDEGIRYAHVEADNFNDAFAQARAQVGPGGVFEYNGRLYGTYYAEEWDNMSSQEKADYQNRVNEVAPSHHNNSQSTHASAQEVEHHDVSPEVVPANAEMISAEPVDNEIRVLGVEAVQNEDGQIMNIALVEREGDQALLLDVDNNGTIDVLLHDDNGDGQLQESEIHDISGAGLDVADLMQAQAAQQGDVLYASNDDMPDYINDADSIMTV